MVKRKPSIEVYLTEEQKVEIKKAAADARLSILDYCLEMIFKGHVNAPIGPTELKLMSSLSGMANNLNQVVKRMHQEKTAAGMEEVKKLIQKIEGLLTL